jgi:hypothetical protein
MSFWAFAGSGNARMWNFIADATMRYTDYTPLKRDAPPPIFIPWNTEDFSELKKPAQTTTKLSSGITGFFSP